VRLATRLIVYIALSSVLPLAVLGTGAATVAANRVLEKTADLQGRTAEAIAVHVDTWVGLQLALVQQQAGTLPVNRLSDAALAGVPELVLNQTPAARCVALLDQDFQPTGPAALWAEDGEQPAAVRAMVRALQDRPPAASTTSIRVSAPYRVPPAQSPSIAVAAPTTGDGLLGVELSLQPISDRIGLHRDPGVQVAVLDPGGNLVLGGGELIDPESVAGLLGGTAVDVRYDTPNGTPVVAAIAPVSPVGWTVIVAEPVERSARALHEIRLRTAYIALVALVLSLVVGVLFSRQLARRVEELTRAALQVADGDYGHQVPPSEESDEIADLTSAFNHMSGRLQSGARDIERQQQEIAAFNAELQQRVDERTRELREARDQLVESARLAAVGEMGAGLAHELNNPVAGILGLTQVLLAKSDGTPGAALLRNIEAQARRCKEILSHLLGLSMDPASSGDAIALFDLRALFRDTLPLMRGPLRMAGIEVEVEDGPPLWVRGSSAEVGRALAQVLSSIRAAAPRGGHLKVEGHAGDHQVELHLQFSGPVVDVGSDNWKAAGMGLWAARRLFVDLHGKLHDPVDCREGTASWRITLPRGKRTE